MQKKETAVALRHRRSAHFAGPPFDEIHRFDMLFTMLFGQFKVDEVFTYGGVDSTDSVRSTTVKKVVRYTFNTNLSISGTFQTCFMSICGFGSFAVVELHSEP
uniref:Uncharacterized protein n=1 Tax=Anopheles culicifacies TaxID=139723 RepID=A0A182M1Y3_9DIPT